MASDVPQTERHLTELWVQLHLNNFPNIPGTSIHTILDLFSVENISKLAIVEDPKVLRPSFFKNILFMS